jgi:flavin reductase
MDTDESELRRLFVAGMGLVASSVTIVATEWNGERRGLTATAMCSLSADPPLLLVCLNRQVAAHDMIHASGCFSVNVLNDQQRDVAARFSGTEGVRGGERFAAGNWGRMHTGAPVLQDATVSFDCALYQAHEVATHTIFIGSVAGVGIGQHQTPLLHARKEYHGLPGRADIFFVGL